MKTVKSIKENLKKELKRVGYNDNQIEIISALINDDISLSYFNRSLLNDDQIRETITFLVTPNSPKVLLLEFEEESRLLMMYIFNKYGNQIINSVKVYRLLYNISHDYNYELLFYVYNKMFCPNINNDFIVELNTSYRNKEDLYKKFNISNNVLVKKIN